MAAVAPVPPTSTYAAVLGRRTEDVIVLASTPGEPATCSESTTEGPGMAILGPRCPAGWLVNRLPTVVQVWLVNGPPLSGTACGEWLERGLPRSK